MAFLHSKKLRTVALVFVLIWATFFFWLLNTQLAVNIVMTLASAICLYAIIAEQLPHFIVVYLSFITAYVLYGYIQVNNLPIWLIMISIFLIYLYLFAYLEQKLEFLRGEKTAFLFIFSLLTLETFLFLGYLIISPINRSLLLAMVVYLIYGFSETVLLKKDPRKIVTYVLVFLAVFATMLLTASWGQI